MLSKHVDACILAVVSQLHHKFGTTFLRSELRDLNNLVGADDFSNTVVLQDAVFLSVPELAVVDFNLNSHV